MSPAPHPVATLLGRLVERARPGTSLPTLLCEEAASRLPVTGASLVLCTAEGSSGLVAASGELPRRLQDLEATLGEGPGLSSLRTHRLVLHPHLAATGDAHWPVYTPAALAQGARAVFTFPLQIGGIVLGVVQLARDTTGALAEDDLARALDLVDTAAMLLVHLDPGTELHEGAVLPEELTEYVVEDAAVHQATGMVSVQAAVGLAEALLLLRAHAFSTDRSVLQVAHDVVDRVLRFDRHPEHDRKDET